MSKTIEERATEYADKSFLVCMSRSSTIKNICIDAYEAGATEQKEIDIKYACKVFCNVLNSNIGKTLKVADVTLILDEFKKRLEL